MDKIKNINCEDELINILILLSHIVIGTIFVICLKNSRPLLLALLLSLIVGYISYSINESIPYYTIPTIGLVIYALELITDVGNNTPMYIKITNTLWKIPYWSIISYYIIIASQTITKK